MKLSICIPTFNRAKLLKNCLNSIIQSKAQTDEKFEVCISNNSSTDETEDVVRSVQAELSIKYSKNSCNIGIPRNFLNVVQMAEGDFIWLIGDDDLLMPNAIRDVCRLIDAHSTVDFFYVNSFHLSIDYLENYPTPFDTQYLPNEMARFSEYDVAGKMKFLELINPKISFDFLGGMFLSVFRRKNWDSNKDILDERALLDDRIFSHFDNTFPHVKIFAKGFSSSIAYYNPVPLNVCLSGAREWSHMYPFIHSVRLVEALDIYRKNGLSLWRYLYCKNFALNNFIPDLVNIILYRKTSGCNYINPLALVVKNCLFPNFYLSFFYFFGRRIRKIVKRFLGS